MSSNDYTSSSKDENENEEEYEYEEYSVEVEEDEDENEYEDEYENEDEEGQEETDSSSTRVYYEESDTERKKHRSRRHKSRDRSSDTSDRSRNESTDMSSEKKNTRRHKKFNRNRELSTEESSLAFNERFYAPKDTDSSGGNYFSGESNTKEDLAKFFGKEKKSVKKRRHVDWQNSDDSFDPVEEIGFMGNMITDEQHIMGKLNNKDAYQLMEEKRNYLSSRIRNLQRLLEKGGLDPAVEAVELKKISRLQEKLKEMDIKLQNRPRNYRSELEDFKGKLHVIRRLKNKHTQIMHGLRQLKYDRETKGTSNNKQRNNLNSKRVYIEQKIEDLGGFVSEDSDYSVGSWDSVEEDRGKEGTFFLVVDRPSALDIPKEKERNGAVFFDPVEGEPNIRKFKGIKDLQKEIDHLINEAAKMDKFRRNKKLSKAEDAMIRERINTLLNRADKLNQLANAKMDPQNVAKHKRLAQLYLKYFDITDTINEALNEDRDPELIKNMVKQRKKIKAEIMHLEKELARSLDGEEDSTEEEIGEKWKLVDEAKERFRRAPKHYKDPYTVNNMLGEAQKLEIKAEKLWNEGPRTRDNRYRVKKSIGRILNIFDDLMSLNRPHRSHGGGGMYAPNIDIRNYFPWGGRHRHGGGEGGDSEMDGHEGRGYRLGGGEGEDGRGDGRFEMDRKNLRDGFPLIYDKYLRESHYQYPSSKLIHYGPLTNSNGNKEIVFIFEDRVICTRANKLDKARFHFKNEILLNTGHLVVKRDALHLDTHSFLNKDNKKHVENGHRLGGDVEVVPKDDLNKLANVEREEDSEKLQEFDEELLEMEENTSVSSSQQNRRTNRKNANKNSKNVQKGKNVKYDSSTSSSSSSDDYSDHDHRKDNHKHNHQKHADVETNVSSSDDEQDDQQEFFCFLVANGRKGKFFYAKSKAEMNFWCKKLNIVLDRQQRERNKNFELQN